MSETRPHRQKQYVQSSIVQRGSGNTRIGAGVAVADGAASIEASLPSRRMVSGACSYIRAAQLKLLCIVSRSSEAMHLWPSSRIGPCTCKSELSRYARCGSRRIRGRRKQREISSSRPPWPKMPSSAVFFSSWHRSDPLWDVISLPGILEDSIAATALKSSPQLPILETTGDAWGRIEFITCGDGADPFSRLSKGFRQNLRTSHNKLDPTDVTFECASTESDLTRLLPEFLNVKSSGWKGELGTSALKEPAMNTFLRQLISQFGPSGRCEIHLMRASNQPIATLFGIVTDNIWYIFRIGYDEAHHRASPGHLIIENLLKRRATHRSFDTLTPYNAPPWFHAWKPDRIVENFQCTRCFDHRPKGSSLPRKSK